MLPAKVSALPSMTPEVMGRLFAFEQENLKRDQVPVFTHHLIHAGMYARTITIEAGTVLTGAHVKIPTILILDGDAEVSLGDRSVRLTGHHVLHASAHRKQAFVAFADTHLTMLFATQARDVHVAEEEFTDQAAMLLSRHGENHVTITGE